MAMQFPKGKFISLVKVGEKGQIVIPCLLYTSDAADE